jgi:AbrB family looped-hinge helix DNA binding protein
MATTLTSKGQVTIPKRIRDELSLLPGAPVQFSVNAAGEVVIHRPRPAKGKRRPVPDRFDAVRGRADVRWRTDELMKLLREIQSDSLILALKGASPELRDKIFKNMSQRAAEMLKDDGVRLPGARREALRRRAEAEGIEVPHALIAAWGG